MLQFVCNKISALKNFKFKLHFEPSDDLYSIFHALGAGIQYSGSTFSIKAG